MAKRGPGARNETQDLSFIYVDRLSLAKLLKETFGDQSAQSKLMHFADLCNYDSVGQIIGDRTANNYLSGKGSRVGLWKFKRSRKNEILSAIGFDKAAFPTIMSQIGFGTDSRSAGQRFKGYAPPLFSIGGQLKLRVQGSKARILEKDNLPDDHGKRVSGPFGRADVRVEHCEIYTEDSQQYDKARNYIRISYPDETGNSVLRPGVVNLMYVADVKKFALVATIRPAVRKICVEAIRGFPDQWDKAITYNGTALSEAAFAALREANEEGGVLLKSDDGKLSIESMKENFADTGKLADRVAFFISAFETLGNAWKSAEPWQMGIVLVDPIKFLEVCASGGGRIEGNNFKYKSRFLGEEKDIYNPNNIIIEDMFTLLAGNLAIRKLSVELSEDSTFASLSALVRERYKR